MNTVNGRNASEVLEAESRDATGAQAGRGWGVAGYPRPSFLAATHLIFLLTLRQLLARKKLIFLFVLLVFPSFIAIVMKWNAEAGLHYLAPLAYLLFLTPIICLFQGASVFGDDVDQKTIGYILVRPIAREAVYLGKWAGVAATSFTMLAFAAVATFLPESYGGSIGSILDYHLFRKLPAFLGVLLLGVALYSALFMLIGLAVRRSTLTGILYYVFVEVAFSMLYGPPSELSIAHHLQRLLPGEFSTVERLQRREILNLDATEPVSGLVVLLGLGAFLFVLMGFGMAAARRNDFHASDDD